MCESCATIASVPIILAVSIRLVSLRVFWGGRLTRQKTCANGYWRQYSGKMLVSSVQMTMGSGNALDFPVQGAGGVATVRSLWDHSSRRGLPTIHLLLCSLARSGHHEPRNSRTRCGGSDRGYL